MHLGAVLDNTETYSILAPQVLGLAVEYIGACGRSLKAQGSRLSARAGGAQAKNEGVNKVRIHILIDGRDVGETSAFEYIDPFEAYLDELRCDNFDIKIASGGGRMVITMCLPNHRTQAIRRLPPEAV